MGKEKRKEETRGPLFLKKQDFDSRKKEKKP